MDRHPEHERATASRSSRECATQHVIGAPYHPNTRSNIKVKGRILLETCFRPGDLQRQTAALADCCKTSVTATDQAS